MPKQQTWQSLIDSIEVSRVAAIQAQVDAYLKANGGIAGFAERFGPRLQGIDSPALFVREVIQIFREIGVE